MTHGPSYGRTGQQAREPKRSHEVYTRLATYIREASEAERLGHYLGYAIPLVIVGLFVFDKAIIRPLMYVACTLPIAVYIYRVRLTHVWTSSYWWLIASFCALWLLSVTWSTGVTLESLWEAVRLGLTVGVFFTGAIAVARVGYLQVEFALTVMTVLALAMGLSALAWAAVTGHLFDPRYRLEGFGFADHPVHAGVMYGFAGIVALKRLVEVDRIGTRVFYAAALVTCAVFVVLTDSRGPLGAMFVASIVLAFARDWRLVLPVMLGFLALVLVGQVSGLIDVVNWIARGTASRLDIWWTVVDDALQRPLFGHGAATVIREFHHHSSHNALLATFYYQGLIGLALVGALTFRVAYDALSAARVGQPQILVMLAFAVPVLMVDNQSLIINLNRDWLILYLPVLMLCRPAVGWKSSRT